MQFLRSPLLTLVAAMALGPVGATTLTSAKPSTPPPDEAASSYASRDQLRDCMGTEASLKERIAALEAESAVHEKMADAVEAEGNKLQELDSHLDHDSTTAVKGYNALVDAHNLHVKQLNQHATDTQPAVSAYNADMLAFNHRCSKLTYRVDDMDVVSKERQKGAVPAGAASASL